MYQTLLFFSALLLIPETIEFDRLMKFLGAVNVKHTENSTSATPACL